MTAILGPYHSPWHYYPADEQYLRDLDPAWVLIHQPSARSVSLDQQAAPNARLMLRSWDIDDDNGNRKRELYADPKEAARKHLEMWRAKWDEIVTEMRKNGWQPDESRWFIQLVNEPDPAYVPQVVEYSLEACRLVKGTQIRLGLVVSSVGTFSKSSENDQGWTKFLPLEQPINEGGHILVVHEYWQPEGPRFGEDAGNLAWRHHSIPLNVPILIGESGANGYIYQRHSQNDDAGWQKFMSPEQYAAQVKEYIEGCDTRVKGVLLYMLDYHSDQWWSFNTGPANQQLLAVKDARPQVPSPFTTKPIDTYLPVIGTGPEPIPATAYVIAPAGANLRAAPIDGQVLQAIPYGEQVHIVGVMDTAGWLRVRVGAIDGYMSANLVALLAPEPLPAPVHGDNWARSIAFVRRWEGGFVNDPNDPGGATNKGITIDTYTRWRKAQGQPQPSVAELRNLSDEEVSSIYYEWYWKASGADLMPWPLCLAVFDLAVNGGVGRAQQALKEAGADFVRFMAWRIAWYTRIDNFERYGRAWIRRCSELMME